MRLVPVRPGLGIHNKWNTQLQQGLGCALHDPSDDGLGRINLIVGNLEHKFVVNLQQHACSQALAQQGFRHADHGAADDVCCRSLDGGIDRGTLDKCPHRRVG